MKNLLFLILIVLCLFLVSCRFSYPETVMKGIEENPFLVAVDLAPSGYDGSSFSFLFFTDAHVNREKHENGGVYRFDDNFFSFLDEGDYPFVISGGDLSDDGDLSLELFAFRKAFYDRGKVLLEAVGNHDRHTYAYSSTDYFSYIQNGVLELNTNEQTYQHYLQSGNGFSTGRYTYGNSLSIYVLDSSMRTLSSRQLTYLEEALQKDTSRYRIMVSHDNIITGGALDQSLFMTGYADIAEITRFLKILDEGKVSIVLSGHHHKGNILYGGDGSGSYTEFNAAAYHRRTSIFESQGWWYTVSIDTGKDLLVLTGYDAETKEARLSYEIQMKTN